MAPLLNRGDYTVGWVCALPIELAAARLQLDDTHTNISIDGDTNIYNLGRIGEHNVVLASLPAGRTGTSSAAAVAMQMKSAFRGIRFGLMVGIGGGVPTAADVRLGDIVVSQPENGHGGVIQYGFGKSTPTGFERIGFLNAPPQILLNAVTQLRSNRYLEMSDLLPHISKLEKIPAFRREEAGVDTLFNGDYNHTGGKTCESCDNTKKRQRDPRTKAGPVIHYGTIASADQVMRNGVTRDQVSSEFGGVLCFEMEAAGLMDNFPCLVIRGICDYADSHKNKRWQPYAAGTAAACAKELLSLIPAVDVAKTQTAEEAVRGYRKPTFYFPFPRNRRFVGRRTALDNLKQKLLVDKDCQKVALAGLGGIGKTQVALDFAYLVKETHPEFSIFWVPALSMEMFEQAAQEIARALGIRQAPGHKEDIKRLVKQRLSVAQAGKWLLIVDNADDMEILYPTGQKEGILDFLPESDDGLTVFTTRHYEVAQSLAGIDVVELEKMGRQEAVDLLENSLVRKGPPLDDALVTDLLTELDYLPLAITQAAAYINVNKSSVPDYVRLLKNTEKDAVTVMSREFRDNTRYRSSANAVATTWIVSFNQISKSDTDAAKILEFISFIEWKAIPHSILPPIQPEARMASAIGMLRSYAFVTRRGGEMIYDMHRLVHLATRIWINRNRRRGWAWAEAVRHLSTICPWPEYENREIWREYLPHAVRTSKDEQAEDTEEKMALCLRIGKWLYINGRIREAVLWVEESCHWRQKELAEWNDDRLSAEHVLAIVYESNGQIREATLAEDHPDRLASQQLAETHPERLTSQHALAQAYLTNEQVADAIELLEHVVTMRQQLAETHPSRLASQHELARAYYANGQVKDALKLFEHVVAVEQKVHAKDHPSRLVSEKSLAYIHEQSSGALETNRSSVHGGVIADDGNKSQLDEVIKAAESLSDNAETLADCGQSKGTVVKRSDRLSECGETRPSVPLKAKTSMVVRLKGILGKKGKGSC
ncbi:kinesin light chain [Rhizodiscina lignyota]|uniref:Kinesin light chain n=1 Tax=Rhizodiscina lignyota TaxID=1504668 RepID=A0A9P4MAM2_9PEZI|nr:kinesin light chain [Rhizodiscina lignyota]